MPAGIHPVAAAGCAAMGALVGMGRSWRLLWLAAAAVLWCQMRLAAAVTAVTAWEQSWATFYGAEEGGQWRSAREQQCHTDEMQCCSRGQVVSCIPSEAASPTMAVHVCCRWSPGRCDGTGPSSTCMFRAPGAHCIRCHGMHCAECHAGAVCDAQMARCALHSTRFVHVSFQAWTPTLRHTAHQRCVHFAACDCAQPHTWPARAHHVILYGSRTPA